MAIGESTAMGSCNRNVIDVEDVMSMATMDGGSGGRACAKPRTILRSIFTLLLHATACLSVSPPVQPVTNYIQLIFPACFF